MKAGYAEKKIKEFESVLCDRICVWLQERLPRITDNWWKELVVQKLSQEDMSGTNDIGLASLNLADLLNVIDKNWFVIWSVDCLSSKYRQTIWDMLTVQNAWEHILPRQITKDKIICDIKIINELLQLFDGGEDELKALEEFILEVEADDSLPYIESGADITHSNTIESHSTIKIGSIVCPVNNESARGVVQSITGNRYTVVINSEKRTYFLEQIKLVDLEQTYRKISLKRLLSSLTAHQIRNPGQNNLYSLNTARIDFVPYQFRPALKIVKSDRPCILIADDVGVGKTIEAGLVLKELEARTEMKSVLVICPRALLVEHKWKEELKRFDEDFIELDGNLFHQCIADMDTDGEWPDRCSKAILSYSLLTKRALYGDEKPSGTVGLCDLEEKPQFDLVIVDEAHHIRNSSTLAYKGVEALCENAGAVVFLSATPLQNSNKDLYTLLNLLRPDIIYDQDTFNMMAEPNKYINTLLLVVREQKEGWRNEAKKLLSIILRTRYGLNVMQNDFRLPRIYNMIEQEKISREDKIAILSEIEGLHTFSNIISRTRRRDIENFCVRRTETVKVKFTIEQRTLYEAIIDFEDQVLRKLHGTYNTRFMMCTIMRQAASCLYGLIPFLDDFIKKRTDAIIQDGELYELDCEISDIEVESIVNLSNTITGFIRKLPQEDPKFDKILEIIENKNCEENNKIIVFSSFKHTLNYLNRRLQMHNVRVGQITGNIKDEERREISKRFHLEKCDKDAIDVLLFTEVGCEGLDYQFCDTMINYDLPWNPMRIEQRIGRIDRRGQKSDFVQIHNIITEGTIDAAIYDRCLFKIGVFQASIGDCAEILGEITDQIMQIMFDSALTEDERMMKLEKITDNDIMRAQELRRLEDEEKTLFGFDLKNYISDGELQAAENQWISPERISNLVNLYLDDLLGEGEYVKGHSAMRNMRIGTNQRAVLLAELKKMPNNNNVASKMWRKYLKSSCTSIPVTYNSESAKGNWSAMFLTQMHPLVQQAAIYESNNFMYEIGVEVSDRNLSSGEYQFLIYSWAYAGIQSDVRLVAISENEYVQSNIFNMIQYAADYDFDESVYNARWDDLEQAHYEKWVKERIAYRELAASDCKFRIDQLMLQLNVRKTIIENKIKNDKDERIIRMHSGQLNKLNNEIADIQKKFSDIAARADIHTELLVKGVLHVSGLLCHSR